MGLKVSQVEPVVDVVFGSISASLERGEGVEIRGFGSFTVRDRGSYEGRDPRTSDPVHVPDKREPWFTAGKEMQEKVNDKA